MSSSDVFCLCNPLVDILAEVPESALQDLDLVSGSMNLIDKTRYNTLLDFIQNRGITTVYEVGGSGANTAVLLAGLGAAAAFGGRVGRDFSGETFENSLCDQRVRPCLGHEDGETGSTIIFVTPDGSRTMNTYLGVAQNFTDADLDTQQIADSQVLYLTAYCLDTDNQRAACMKAMQTAKQSNTKVAISLADSFCVTRHKATLEQILADYADIILMNEEEALQMTNTQSIAAAGAQLSRWATDFVITEGVQGASVYHQGNRQKIAALPTQVVDTTGAGDSFAAGYLYGLLTWNTPLQAGQLGARIASKIVAQWGSRYRGDIATLLRSFEEHQTQA